MKKLMKKLTIISSLLTLMVINIISFSNSVTAKDAEGCVFKSCRIFKIPDEGICWVILDYECPWGPESRHVGDC